MIALYWIVAFVLLLSALGTIASRQPVHSVVGLIVNFAALAVLFLTLSAEFLAMMQIIIYAGAILVLFLFVIALLTVGNVPVELGEGKLPFQTLPSIAAGIIALAAMWYGVRVAWAGSAAASTSAFGTVATFGDALLTTHVFVFEVTAFVLLVAIIGVILLAGRHQVQ